MPVMSRVIALTRMFVCAVDGSSFYEIVLDVCGARILSTLSNAANKPGLSK